MVECDLAKVEVAGSNPVSRSRSQRRGTQVVRERSAKPLCVGSIPTRASISPQVRCCARVIGTRLEHPAELAAWLLRDK